MEATRVVERPISITVLCGFMALGLVATVALVVIGPRDTLPGWYMPFLGTTSLVGAICMVGLWKMRSWAVPLYAAMVIASQVGLAVSGLWAPTMIIAPMIALVVMFASYEKMI